MEGRSGGYIDTCRFRVSFYYLKKKKTTSGTGGGEGSFNKRSSARKYPSNHLALRWMERIYTASSDCNRAVLDARASTSR